MSIWSHLGRSRLRAEDNRKPHHPVTLRTSTVATIRILPHWEIIRSRHSFSSGLAPRITTAARRFGLYRVLSPAGACGTAVPTEPTWHFLHVPDTVPKPAPAPVPGRLAPPLPSAPPPPTPSPRSAPPQPYS